MIRMGLVLAAVLMAGCTEKPEPSTCKGFADAIDGRMKMAAYDYSDGLMDNSAPRETNRQLRLALAMTEIGIQVQLMGQHKCPPINKPINIDTYFASAIECRGKLMDWREGKPRPGECAYETWNPAR
jgi:hypothetical protein